MSLRLFFCLLFLLTWGEGSIFPPLKFQWELSIATVFQNDAPFLKEWIEFHRIVGVEHFWLYNNNSEDNYLEVLNPYIEEGIVELIDWPEKSRDLNHWNSIQCSGFMDAIKRARGKSVWVAFIDTDEFLFAVREDSLPKFLQNYKQFGGVTANWQGFGTSHVAKLAPGELLIENLTWRNPPDDPFNYHVKSIVNPFYIKDCRNPHFFFYVDNQTQVTSKKVPFTGPFSPMIDVSDIRINHYWVRDEYYLYHHKIPRKKHWKADIDKLIEKAENFNYVEDEAIWRFLPRLKKRL